MTGADSVAREGQAQQGKASAEDEARRNEKEARKARDKAERKASQQR